MPVDTLCCCRYNSTQHFASSHSCSVSRETEAAPESQGLGCAACLAQPAPRECACLCSAAPSLCLAPLPAHSGEPSLTHPSAAHGPGELPKLQPLLLPTNGSALLRPCLVLGSIQNLHQLFATFLNSLHMFATTLLTHKTLATAVHRKSCSEKNRTAQGSAEISHYLFQHPNQYTFSVLCTGSSSTCRACTSTTRSLSTCSSASCASSISAPVCHTSKHHNAFQHIQHIK